MKVSYPHRTLSLKHLTRVSFIVFSLLLAGALSVSETRAQAGRRPVLVDRSMPVNVGPAQSNQRRNPVASGNSSVRGRVVYEDNGQPVAHARVIINARETDTLGRPVVVSTMTDGRGEFRFENLPAGRYTLFVSDRDSSLPNAFAVQLPIPGLTGELGPDEELPDENGSLPVSVNLDGTGSMEVELKMSRPGAITGRVLSATGEPVAGAQVNFVRQRKQGGRVTGLYRRSVLTNKEGAYGMDLPAGEYMVSAIGPKKGNRTTVSFPDSSLLATYYPSATSQRSATPVRVASGGEASGVDIRLITDRPLHKINGIVTSKKDGQPLAGISVSITQGDGSEMSLGPMIEGRTTQTDDEGRWTIKNVPDGEYVLEVNPMVYRRGPQMGRPRMGTGGPGSTIPMRTPGGVSFPTGPAMPPPGMRRIMPKKQELIVAGADVSGLALTVSEGGRVSGTVSTEDGSSVPAGTVIIQLPQLQNAGGRPAQPDAQTSAGPEPPMIEGPRMRQIPRPTFVRPDGTFAVDIVPFVKVRLKVEVPDQRYYVKSMTLGGVDILRTPQEFDSETDMTGLQVVLATNTATLTGRVTTAQGGQTLGGVHVVLVPADPERRAGNHIFGMTNPEGIFKISSPPGDYFVYVIPPGEQPLSLSDAEHAGTPARALRLKLNPNESKEVSLTALR